MRRWTKTGEWFAHRSGPEVLVRSCDDGDWTVYADGLVISAGRSSTQRAAKRAAERWVETFARELLIACGKESP